MSMHGLAEQGKKSKDDGFNKGKLDIFFSQRQIKLHTKEMRCIRGKERKKSCIVHCVGRKWSLYSPMYRSIKVRWVPLLLNRCDIIDQTQMRTKNVKSRDARSTRRAVYARELPAPWSTRWLWGYLRYQCVEPKFVRTVWFETVVAVSRAEENCRERWFCIENTVRDARITWACHSWARPLPKSASRKPVAFGMPLRLPARMLLSPASLASPGQEVLSSSGRFGDHETCLECVILQQPSTEFIVTSF